MIIDSSIVSSIVFLINKTNGVTVQKTEEKKIEKRARFCLVTQQQLVSDCQLRRRLLRRDRPV